MLTGGFYSVDAALICEEVKEEEFLLRCDGEGRYARRAYVNNGRTATIYALRQAGERMWGKKILLPDYLCVSVLTAIDCVKEEYGLSCDFYRVDEKLEIDMEDLQRKLTPDVGMIYVIHYFAVPQPEAVAAALSGLARERGILIFEDLTQALFSRAQGRMGYGDLIAASTRKWFPMTDGGLAALRDTFPAKEISLQDPYNEAAYRELLISVVREYFDKNPGCDRETYLKFEREANASRYIDLEIRGMTEASRRVFFNSDKEELIRRRRENYACLYEELADCRGLRLLGPRPGDSDLTPFGLVILCEDRDRLYGELTARDIVPEIQWILPTDRYQPGEAARYLSDHNLMLQCDQRYGPEDMRRTAAAVKKLLGRRS